ncbi:MULTISPECIES: hypothetical protein [unclassified Rummeliibacillus]|uniref:hypothetical protein n=1 Tax=unclassified Rummeliibacillus TaxID=2622809 RepID=UPI000E6612C0|nr:MULTISPECIES: hypothetical protein [unclassified Rummeliibacillus]RIJ67125.1 hypothetical protein D1606_05070 [Rummeliibacillus sp. POC4]RPJ96138.1 hypothetical protein CW357_06345 [Rummeliibacillus sp. TYF005]
MVKEQTEKSVDLVWDGLLNGLKTWQQFQTEVGEKALQSFTYQKDFIESTVSTINTIEEESKKATKEILENVQTSVKEVFSNEQYEQFSKWLTSVQEITDKSQELVSNPSHSILDTVVQTNNLLESTVKDALEEQKQQRLEVIEKIEELAEQLKQTQKGLFSV